MVTAVLLVCLSELLLDIKNGRGLRLVALRPAPELSRLLVGGCRGLPQALTRAHSGWS